MIDTGELTFHPSANDIQQLHKLFCDNLPSDLLWVENPDKKMAPI
jgi:hypothetical protein